MKKLVGMICAILILLPVCANATTIDFYNDGWITDGNVFDTVNIWNTSNVSMTGGDVDFMYSYNSSRLNLSGGLISRFWSYGDSIVNITGGKVDTFIYAYDNSILNISGGIVNCFINLHNSSVLNLSGGIEHAWIYPDTGTVNFYGRDLTWVIDSEKRVHGYWADNSEFLITLARIENANIVFHEIPEPAMITLLLAGILGIRRFRD